MRLKMRSGVQLFGPLLAEPLRPDVKILGSRPDSSLVRRPDRTTKGEKIGQKHFSFTLMLKFIANLCNLNKVQLTDEKKFRYSCVQVNLQTHYKSFSPLLSDFFL